MHISIHLSIQPSNHLIIKIFITLPIILLNLMQYDTIAVLIFFKSNIKTCLNIRKLLPKSFVYDKLAKVNLY